MSKLDHIKIGDTDYEVQDSELTSKVASLETSVTAVQTEVENKQDKLTAGDNITIENGVISATGGGSSDLSVGSPIIINDVGYNLQIVDNVISLVELGKYYTVTSDGSSIGWGLSGCNLTGLESDNFKIISYTGSLSFATKFTAKMLSSAQLTLRYHPENNGYTGLSISPKTACLYSINDNASPTITISNLTANITIKAEASCLTGDTLIAMGDGTQKRVDSLELGDKILAIDPNTLELVEDEVTYTDSKCNKTHNEYDVWTFEDGYEIKTVHRHRLYNCESEAFVNMDEWAIGDHTRTIDGKEIALISHKHINELVKHYTLFTKNYNNYFANGMLTGNKHSKELTFED